MNISTNKEKIRLNKGKTYYILDALYLSNINENIEVIDKNNLDDIIAKTVFPDAVGPFIKYTSKTGIFDPAEIKKIKYSKEIEQNPCVLSVDSGLLIFVEEHIILTIIELFDFDTLLDSTTFLYNVEYAKQLLSQFNENDIALIFSPGVSYNFDFDGSGLYLICN